MKLSFLEAITNRRESRLHQSILFIQPTTNRSGAELSLDQLLGYAFDYDVNTHLLVGEQGTMYRQLSDKCLTTSLVKVPKLTRRVFSILNVIASVPSLYLAMRRIIKKNKVTTVYINTLMIPHVMIIATLFPKCRVFIHIREVETTYPKILYNFFLFLASISADKLVIVCDYIRCKQSSWSRRLIQEKSELLYNSSGLQPSKTRRPLSGEIQILSVIPVTKRKGIVDLVAFAENMRSIWPEQAFKIHVLGRIDQKEVFEEVIEKIRQGCLDDFFHFHGEVHDVGHYYSEAHLLLHPSHTEAFPRVIVEAMNMALPVVVTDVGGSSEAVVEGVTGHVVQVGDVAAMARYVKKICSCEKIYQNYCVASYQAYSEKFAPAVIGKQFINILLK